VDGRDVLRDVQVERDPFLAEAAAGLGDGVVKQSDQVDRLRLQADLAGVQGDNPQQILNQGGHALDVGFDALQEFALGDAQDAHRFAQQQVDIAGDGTHRCA